MFTDLMYSTGIANDILKLNSDSGKNVDEEYKKVFGITSNDLFNEFMSIYTRHAGNAYYVKNMTLFAEPEFEPTGNKSIDDFEPKSVVIDGDKLKVDIFNGARIKEKQKALTQEEESEITWLDDVDYYDMLAEMTEEEKEEAQAIKVKSLKYSPEEKQRFRKNMESLRAKGFYTNQKGEVVFPYIIKQKMEQEREDVEGRKKKYIEEAFFVLKSVSKAQKQPKEASKRLIQPGETVASGVRAVYEKIEKRGSKKTFKAGEMFDAIPKTADVPRYRKTTQNSTSYNPFYAPVFEDPEKEALWMANHGFVTPGETSPTQKKEVAAIKASNSAQGSSTRTPKQILAEEYGITFTLDPKTGTFKFGGDVWEEIPDDMKKNIKTPSQLLTMFGYTPETLTAIKQPASPKTNVVSEESSTPGALSQEEIENIKKNLAGPGVVGTGSGLTTEEIEAIKRNLASGNVIGDNNPLNDDCATK
jgi:hypothetical protein